VSAYADDPLVVGLGGSTREGSSSELVLRRVLSECEARGARTIALCGRELDLPMYAPAADLDEKASRLVEALRQADAVVICSPGYHGAPSGLIKNALDYVEELRDDARPYLDGRPVGCVVCAYGWQATTTTLVSLRSVVHALRGWPTPLGVAVNSAELSLGEDGEFNDAPVSAQLSMLAEQLLSFPVRAVVPG
jgi:FMN reductase